MTAARDAATPAAEVRLLHPGMPKAASTWLQNVFFAQHPQLAVLGPEDTRADLAQHYVAAIERLVLGSDLQDLDALGGELAALAREGAARRPGAQVVGLSHEALAGAWPAPRNTGFVAKALAKMFPAAKVLLVVREQRAALVSGWREFVRMGGTLSFRRFVLDPAVGGDPVVHPLATAVLGTVTLAPIVRVYREAFGGERVLVLPFEQLQRDADGFARAICDFVGTAACAAPPQHANVQLSGVALAILRRCNHLFNTRRHPRYGPQPISSSLAWLGVPRGDAWRTARANPYYVRYRISDYCQRWLAKRLMPRLDRLGLAAVSRRGDPFGELPSAAREFLAAHFAADTRALRDLVAWDPAAYGYRGSEG